MSISVTHRSDIATPSWRKQTREVVSHDSEQKNANSLFFATSQKCTQVKETAKATICHLESKYISCNMCRAAAANICPIKSLKLPPTQHKGESNSIMTI